MAGSEAHVSCIPLVVGKERPKGSSSPSLGPGPPKTGDAGTSNPSTLPDRRGGSQALHGVAGASAQQTTSRWNARSAVAPILSKVLTNTPLGAPAREPTEAYPVPGVPAAVSPVVAWYSQPRTSRLKITW